MQKMSTEIISVWAFVLVLFGCPEWDVAAIVRYFFTSRLQKQWLMHCALWKQIAVYEVRHRKSQ
jgi:hypothetical protein